MRVFVTGATGLIGSAVVRELMKANHHVLGLARSDASAALLAQMGAQVQRGDLMDTNSLVEGVQCCDGVIHTGFIHDFSDLHASIDVDRAVIKAMGDALTGSDRPFVGTSGTMLLAPGHFGTEDDAADPHSAGAFRVANENLVLSLSAQHVRACVVRPSPSVHGEADQHGFIPALIALAREKGVSAYVGDGLNRWPAVHQLDAAHLFRLALEKGAAGARYHAVADEGVHFREIAEAIGRGLNIPVVTMSPNEAGKHFGWMSFVVGVDNPTSSTRTQERLGWQPTQPGLVADLGTSHYFET